MVKRTPLLRVGTFISAMVLVSGCATGPSRPPLRETVIEKPNLWPLSVKGRISSYFGIRRDPYKRTRRFHKGVDIAAPKNTAVFATAPGKVYYSKFNRHGYGNLVKVDHGRGISTWYAHLSKRLVTQGQKVDRGRIIGRVGSTGRATGNHLHYEVHRGETALNPMAYLPQPTSRRLVQR